MGILRFSHTLGTPVEGLPIIRVIVPWVVQVSQTFVEATGCKGFKCGCLKEQIQWVWGVGSRI